jgi:hypothetical protein
VVSTPKANAFVGSPRPDIADIAPDRRSVPKPREGDFQQVLGGAGAVSDGPSVRNRHSPVEPIIDHQAPTQMADLKL